jgi:ribose transport system substrate-binding protein
MVRQLQNSRRGRLLLAAALAGVVALAGACSSSTGAAKPHGTGSGASTANKAAAPVHVAQGRDKEAPSLPPNPAVAHKKLAIISFAQSNESGYIPAGAAKTAAQQIGWDATIYDAKTNVGAITGLVRQAQASGANAIITVNIDCDFAAKAFADAKAAGMVIVPINGFDCDDPGSPAGVGKSGFSADIQPGGGLTPDEFWKQDGSDMAKVAIADSHNTAKIISVESDGLAVEVWQHRGFDSTIESSGGSKIVDKVTFTTADFVTGRLTTMVEAALTKHPEATYIKSTFSASTIANVIPAIRASHSKIKVLGGEGLQSELALVRSGQLLATDTTPSAWFGWAAVDTVNSLFRHAKPHDSGLQWVTVMKDNVPASGPVEAADYQSAYRKSWGLT